VNTLPCSVDALAFASEAQIRLVALKMDRWEHPPSVRVPSRKSIPVDVIQYPKRIALVIGNMNEAKQRSRELPLGTERS
jgi:hypothetical protein